MELKDLTPLQLMAIEAPGDFLAGVQSAFGQKVIEHLQLHATDALKALLACNYLDQTQLDMAKTLKFKYESINQLIEDFKDAMALATEQLNRGDTKETTNSEEEPFDGYGYG